MTTHKNQNQRQNTEKAVAIEGVSKRYQDLLAVDHLSLEIHEGEIFGLIGPNGAGKSTLVNMLCGVVSMDKGNIDIFGARVQGGGSGQTIEAKRNLGVVPQEIALFEHMSVVQNLKFFASLYGLKGKDLARALAEALALSQLEDKRNKKVKTLSGGMKRRLNIACSLVHQPRILVLDEPTVGIDPHSRNHILEVVKTLNRDKGMTIIYITHYMEEVEHLCDRIGIIDGGQVKLVGSKGQIIDSISDEIIVNLACLDLKESQIHQLKALEGMRSVARTETGALLIGKKGTVTFDQLSTALTQMGAAVTSLSMDTPSLESAFLQLTGRALRDA